MVIHPIKLAGNWDDGYVLDNHTISSQLIGYDHKGRKSFDTEYSEIGSHLHSLKYDLTKWYTWGRKRRIIKDTADMLASTMIDFINKNTSWDADMIIPIPASNIYRKFQPVELVGKLISKKTNIPYRSGILRKVVMTPQLKEIGIEKRADVLRNSLNVQAGSVSGKNVLLIDDLYQSGTTLKIASELLKKVGNARTVYVIAITKTRR